MPGPDSNSVESLLARIAVHCAAVPRRIQIMEICGTHTVSIFRSGLRARLPKNLRLVSGPGCPVCVTAQRHIDAAIELAADPRVIIATYGDMIRVPGRRGSLEEMRARGATIRVVTSARTCLELARAHPNQVVVFLAVGFETTAPATAATIVEAERAGLENFGVVMCHKLVVPAMQALLDAGDVPLDGFIAPGHVSVIIGADAYVPIVEQYRRPVVVAGFEPLNIARGLERLTAQIAAGQGRLENVYGAAVGAQGNRAALALFDSVFVIADTPWRELGVIPLSGFELAPRYQRFDALRRFGVAPGVDVDHPGCRCGEVICGKAEPPECALFAGTCTPLSPIGPCMVSSEGTCSAWYKYSRAVAGATA
jgi:hydrogenase expression/formation protein HypD